LPITVGKETTVITEPLHEDGTVDYIAALNARMSKGVTPENNAFVAWLGVVGTSDINPKVRDQMLKMCGAKEHESQWIQYRYSRVLQRHGIEGEAAHAVWDDEDKALKQLWDEKDFPFVAAMLKEKGPSLDKVKEAFSRSKFWMPYVAGDGRSMVSVHLPPLSLFRDAANGLCARAMFRLKAGDFDGFLSDVISVKQMARRIGQGATLIEKLVGTGIDSRASRSIATVAGMGILSAKQGAELAKALEGLEPMPRVWESFDTFERWHTLDSVALLATGNSALFEPVMAILAETLSGEMEQVPESENINLCAVREMDLAWVDWDAVLKRVNRLFDTQAAIIKNPDLGELRHEQENVEVELKAAKQSEVAGWGKRQAGETREAYTQRIGDGIINLFFSSSIDGTERLFRWQMMEHEMMKVVVAAGRWRAEKGEWPERLEALIPGYLKEVPVDIYSGKRVLYVRGEKGVRVYSVGRNRYDDGGMRGTLKDGREADDIVIGVEVE